MFVREKTSFVSGNIKGDVNLIKSFYRSLGYYFVKIDAEIEKLEKNRVNIFYSIDAGEKAKISKIYFLGDKNEGISRDFSCCLRFFLRFSRASICNL